MINLSYIYQLIVEENNIIKSKYTLYQDMDGCLTDFDVAFTELTNGISPNDYKKEHGIDGFWNLIDKEGVKFWSEMPWMEDGKQLWDYIKKYSPTLLTSPSIEQDSRTGKQLWVDKEIPNTDIIFKYSKSKKDKAKENSILIDDRKSIIDDWENAGGIGILHTSTNNTINQLKKLGL